MGQNPLHGITSGENKWRSNTEPQKQRNTLMMVLKRPEKIAFIKWAKAFDAEPLGYTRFCQGQYPLPKDSIVKIMAIGYLSDISEVKRLYNEEEEKVNWTPIPFGVSEAEWNDPDTVADTLMDREDAEYAVSSEDEDEDSEPAELGTNPNLLEEVADESEPEPDPDPEPEQVKKDHLTTSSDSGPEDREDSDSQDSDSEIRSLVTELPSASIN
jgi:hypothetical protein